MGLVQYFGGSFYAPLANAKELVLGQFVWCPAPALLPDPYVLEAERPIKTSHAIATARYTPMTDAHFKKREQKELPILNLRLGETDEIIAYKAKLRPGIVVGLGANMLGGAAVVAKHHEENRAVVAPVYDVRTEDDPHGFSPEMSARVRHLMYKQYFPVAPYTERRLPRDVIGGVSLREGVARFDRLQFVAQKKPGCVPIPLRLSDDVLALLHAQLWTYLHAEPLQPLEEMRSVLLELAPKEIR